VADANEHRPRARRRHVQREAVPVEQVGRRGNGQAATGQPLLTGVDGAVRTDQPERGGGPGKRDDHPRQGEWQTKGGAGEAAHEWGSR
jgi:hypothetical protein